MHPKHKIINNINININAFNFEPPAKNERTRYKNNNPRDEDFICNNRSPKRTFIKKLRNHIWIAGS
jgi:hypothetical protein